MIVWLSTYERAVAERDEAREIARQMRVLRDGYVGAYVRTRDERDELRAEVTRLTAELARRSDRPRGVDGKWLKGAGS